LQGARLTCWELKKNGIDVTLITDNMVAHLMQLKKIQGVFTGSDRIAANGDVANKIGTYGVALLAHHHGIPFYAVAPYSTIDLHTPTGAEIPIEERAPDEVHSWNGTRTAPEGIQVFNPAFDVTPQELVKAIITERGILRPPYGENLAKHVK
jgi:methylthioribose-1-phosphate isomerase